MGCKKKHKLKTTRPEFLLELMGGNPHELSDSDMKRTLHDTNALTYCAYTAIMDADIDREDIISMNNDGESIAITFKSKSTAKAVLEACSDDTVRYGSHVYSIKAKLRDKHLILEVREVEEENED